jgi:hypothetical protein
MMSKRDISIIIKAVQDFGDYDHATPDEFGEVDVQTEKVIEALTGSDVSITGLSCHLNGVEVLGIEEY